MELKVMKGGYDPSQKPKRRKFLSAEATDTRLMGVSALAVCWEVFPYEDSDIDSYHFHQFFYYDAEEFGLDSYRSMRGDDQKLLEAMQKSMVGGLGGKNVLLTEREARALVQMYIAGSEKQHTPPAEPFYEYSFFLEDPVILSRKERDFLWRKICTPLKSASHLIHYFLMRLAGHDTEAANYLASSPDVTENALSALKQVCPKPVTLCKNDAEIHTDSDGSTSYMVESVLEDDNGYLLMTSEVKLLGDPNPNEDRVASFRVHSHYRITSEEAAMQLNRSEYITCFSIQVDPDIFEILFSVFSLGFMLTNHDMGRLFMEFNDNNDHVNRKVFKLHEDVNGLYYVSDTGQFLLGAYSEKKIDELEARLAASPLADVLRLLGRYSFRDEVLYDFIQSGYDDFLMYVETLREE